MDSKEKIIVIPDIHGREFWKEAVRGHEKESIVFLGDYVDPYTYEGIEQEKGLEMLEQVIEFKKDHMDNVTLLLGNHDLGYPSKPTYILFIPCALANLFCNRKSARSFCLM